MKDFNLVIYKQLLESVLNKNYIFQTMQNFILNPDGMCVSMRHDVDRKPQNSLRMANLENKLGIKATYYFRTIPQTFKSEIIREIFELEHEIGYHYECLAETNGDYEKAIVDFEKNLEILRKIVPIKNIAMHGRPTSKWDSRLLWDKYDYKEYGVISEPYFDIDFNEVLYISDAGRSWNNDSVNLRDKVESKFDFTFKHTKDMISAFEKQLLPDKIMINIHPEHWADSTTEWWKIWTIRKIKNTVKRVIIRT
jgi:hypothetical protein